MPWAGCSTTGAVAGHNQRFESDHPVGSGGMGQGNYRADRSLPVTLLAGLLGNEPASAITCGTGMQGTEALSENNNGPAVRGARHTGYGTWNVVTGADTETSRSRHVLSAREGARGSVVASISSARREKSSVGGQVRQGDGTNQGLGPCRSPCPGADQLPPCPDRQEPHRTLRTRWRAPG